VAIKQLQLTQNRQKWIVDWLFEEIMGLNGALSLRKDKEAQWIKWNKNYEELPDQDTKNFPFERASNIVAPIQSITVNAFVARQYNTLFGTPTLWSAKALQDGWADHVMPSQRLLEYAQKQEMKMMLNSVSWFYDIANTGLGVVKLPWIIDRRSGKRYDERGEIIAYEGEISQGPRFIPIPRTDFIYPVMGEDDVQKMVWVAHRFRLRWPVIEMRAKNGTYIKQNVDDTKGHYTSVMNRDEVEDEAERVRKEIRAFNLELYDTYEVWCFCDYDQDGWEESCVFTVNFESKKILRATLNPFLHGKRPFIATPCFPRPHSLEGIGFGQKLERLQEGLTTVINQSIDNATLANTRGYIARRGSGIKPGTKLWPGKVFMVDDVTNDLKPFAMADIYSSSEMIFRNLLMISEKSTGVSDYNLGRESTVAGSASTATSTLALIQEGNKLFDFLLKRERVDMSEMAYQIYALYSQFKPVGLAFTLLGEDGELVKEAWMAKGVDVRRSLQFELTAASPHVNKALEREAWVQLYNLILGYYSKLFEVAGVLVDPAAPPQLKDIAAKMVVASQHVMERVVERWETVDADKALINPEDLIALAKSQPPQGELGGGNGQIVGRGAVESPTAPGPRGITTAPRVGGLQQFIGPPQG